MTSPRTGPQLLAGQPRLAVVGPGDLTAAVLACRQEADAAGVTLTAHGYRSERTVGAVVRRACRAADALLFTGPVPMDSARALGELTRPSVAISLSGDALYRAMLNAVIGLGSALSAASIDTIQRADVLSVYDELTLDASSVQTLPYVADGRHDVARVVDFHRRAHLDNGDVALTCRRDVDLELRRLDVPVVRVRPTRHAMVTALRTAVLLAGGTIARESQLAMCLVGIDGSSHGALDSHGQRELGGELYRLLLKQSRRLAATVVPLDARTILLVTTAGALEATGTADGLGEVARLAKAELGITVSIGVGAGKDAREAEDAAHRSMALAQQRGGNQIAMIAGGIEQSVSMPTELPAAASVTPAQRDWRRLWEALRPSNGSAAESTMLVLDARIAAEALDVTERSARRMLVGLAEAGLAWPVPAVATVRGRPRQRYRLAGPTGGEFQNASRQTSG